MSTSDGNYAYIFLKLAISIILFFYWLYYVYLLQAIKSIHTKIIFSLTCIILPIWLAFYELEKITYNLMLYVILVVFLLFLGNVLSKSFIQKAQEYENKHNREFPKHYPENWIDIIPAHIAAILFMFAPIIMRTIWSTFE